MPVLPFILLSLWFDPDAGRWIDPAAWAAVPLVVVIITFARDNLPRPEDLRWLLHGGGLFGGKEIASHRFNAGEKVLFWAGVFLLGLVVVGQWSWHNLTTSDKRQAVVTKLQTLRQEYLG